MTDRGLNTSDAMIITFDFMKEYKMPIIIHTAYDGKFEESTSMTSIAMFKHISFLVM